MTNPIRVVLADDHAVVRAGIRQFLEQATDIKVVAQADDGQIARSLIAQQPHCPTASLPNSLIAQQPHNTRMVHKVCFTRGWRLTCYEKYG